MKSRYLLATASVLAMLAVGGYVAAQVTLPQVLAVGPTDLIQVIPGGSPHAGNQYATAATLATGEPLPLGNAIIGGDATTNLWQRATSGSSVTTTLTYGGPDRWAYWSGTGTAMKVIRSSTAADLPAGFQYAFKMQRTAAQTGVIQMCMAQEIESANSYQFQGHVAELSFNAFTGANFSAASANMNAYIITGTGADEGLAGTSSMAFTLNAGGGGSGGWAGQANATVGLISLGAVSTAGRYAVAANIPAGATEIGVALCYTPVGTAGANDYIAFDGIQLSINDALPPSFVSSTVGYNVGTSGFPAKPFERRTITIEAVKQYRYFYNGITDSAASAGVAQGPMGVLSSTTTCDMVMPLPVVMRIAPTVTFTGTALGTTTWRIQDSTTSTLGTPFLAQLVANTPQFLTLRATLTTASTAGWGCQLQSSGTPTTATINASAEL